MVSHSALTPAQLPGAEIQIEHPVGTKTTNGPRVVRQGVAATYRFGSSAAGSSFQCRIDRAAWRSCRSPWKVATRRLKIGRHVLWVRAVQPVGNADATPARTQLRVKRR